MVLKFLLECITECTDYQPMDKVAACAYVCEMTHGYENAEFLENMQCLIDNQCLPQYPDDGICYGQDSDGLKSITSMDQVSKMGEIQLKSIFKFRAFFCYCFEVLSLAKRHSF